MRREERFPAPGSDTAGAPPPLRRRLTPSDGVPDPAAADATPADVTPAGSTPAGSAPTRSIPPGSTAEGTHPRSSRDDETATVLPRSALWCAAALAGVAGGLELAGWLHERRVRRCSGTRRAQLSG